VEDVLSYVEYEPKLLINRFRKLVESALRHFPEDFRKPALEAAE